MKTGKNGKDAFFKMYEYTQLVLSVPPRKVPPVPAPPAHSAAPGGARKGISCVGCGCPGRETERQGQGRTVTSVT